MRLMLSLVALLVVLLLAVQQLRRPATQEPAAPAADRQLPAQVQQQVQEALQAGAAARASEAGAQ